MSFRPAAVFLVFWAVLLPWAVPPAAAQFRMDGPLYWLPEAHSNWTRLAHQWFPEHRCGAADAQQAESTWISDEHRPNCVGDDGTVWGWRIWAHEVDLIGAKREYGRGTSFEHDHVNTTFGTKRELDPWHWDIRNAPESQRCFPAVNYFSYDMYGQNRPNHWKRGAGGGWGGLQVSQQLGEWYQGVQYLPHIKQPTVRTDRFWTGHPGERRIGINHDLFFGSFDFDVYSRLDPAHTESWEDGKCAAKALFEEYRSGAGGDARGADQEKECLATTLPLVMRATSELRCEPDLENYLDAQLDIRDNDANNAAHPYMERFSWRMNQFRKAGESPRPEPEWWPAEGQSLEVPAPWNTTVVLRPFLSGYTSVPIQPDFPHDWREECANSELFGCGPTEPSRQLRTESCRLGLEDDRDKCAQGYDNSDPDTVRRYKIEHGRAPLFRRFEVMISMPGEPEEGTGGDYSVPTTDPVNTRADVDDVYTGFLSESISTFGGSTGTPMAALEARMDGFRAAAGPRARPGSRETYGSAAWLADRLQDSAGKLWFDGVEVVDPIEVQDLNSRIAAASDPDAVAFRVSDCLRLLPATGEIADRAAADDDEFWNVAEWRECADRAFDGGGSREIVTAGGAATVDRPSGGTARQSAGTTALNTWLRHQGPAAGPQGELAEDVVRRENTARTNLDADGWAVDESGGLVGEEWGMPELPRHLQDGLNTLLGIGGTDTHVWYHTPGSDISCLWGGVFPTDLVPSAERMCLQAEARVLGHTLMLIHYAAMLDGLPGGGSAPATYESHCGNLTPLPPIDPPVCTDCCDPNEQDCDPPCDPATQVCGPTNLQPTPETQQTRRPKVYHIPNGPLVSSPTFRPLANLGCARSVDGIALYQGWTYQFYNTYECPTYYHPTGNERPPSPGYNSFEYNGATQVYDAKGPPPRRRDPRRGYLPVTEYHVDAPRTEGEEGFDYEELVRRSDDNFRITRWDRSGPRPGWADNSHPVSKYCCGLTQSGHPGECDKKYPTQPMATSYPPSDLNNPKDNLATNPRLVATWVRAARSLGCSSCGCTKYRQDCVPDPTPQDPNNQKCTTVVAHSYKIFCEDTCQTGYVKSGTPRGGGTGNPDATYDPRDVIRTFGNRRWQDPPAGVTGPMAPGGAPGRSNPFAPAAAPAGAFPAPSFSAASAGAAPVSPAVPPRPSGTRVPGSPAASSAAAPPLAGPAEYRAAVAAPGRLPFSAAFAPAPGRAVASAPGAASAGPAAGAGAGAVPSAPSGTYGFSPDGRSLEAVRGRALELSRDPLRAGDLSSGVRAMRDGVALADALAANRAQAAWADPSGASGAPAPGAPDMDAGFAPLSRLDARAGVDGVLGASDASGRAAPAPAGVWAAAEAGNDRAAGGWYGWNVAGGPCSGGADCARAMQGALVRAAQVSAGPALPGFRGIPGCHNSVAFTTPDCIQTLLNLIAFHAAGIQLWAPTLQGWAAVTEYREEILADLTSALGSSRYVFWSDDPVNGFDGALPSVTSSSYVRYDAGFAGTGLTNPVCLVPESANPLPLHAIADRGSIQYDDRNAGAGDFNSPDFDDTGLRRVPTVNSAQGVWPPAAALVDVTLPDGSVESIVPGRFEGADEEAWRRMFYGNPRRPEDAANTPENFGYYGMGSAALLDPLRYGSDIGELIPRTMEADDHLIDASGNAYDLTSPVLFRELSCPAAVDAPGTYATMRPVVCADGRARTALLMPDHRTPCRSGPDCRERVYSEPLLYSGGFDAHYDGGDVEAAFRAGHQADRGAPPSVRDPFSGDYLHDCQFGGRGGAITGVAAHDHDPEEGYYPRAGFYAVLRPSDAPPLETCSEASPCAVPDPASRLWSFCVSDADVIDRTLGDFGDQPVCTPNPEGDGSWLFWHEPFAAFDNFAEVDADGEFRPEDSDERVRSVGDFRPDGTLIERDEDVDQDLYVNAPGESRQVVDEFVTTPYELRERTARFRLWDAVRIGPVNNKIRYPDTATAPSLIWGWPNLDLNDEGGLQAQLVNYRDSRTEARQQLYGMAPGADTAEQVWLRNEGPTSFFGGTRIGVLTRSGGAPGARRFGGCDLMINPPGTSHPEAVAYRPVLSTGLQARCIMLKGVIPENSCITEP